MAKHDHHSECAHEDVRYCKQCDTAYCAACPREWPAQCQLSHYPYQWTWTQPYITTPAGSTTVTLDTRNNVTADQYDMGATADLNVHGAHTDKVEAL